MKLSVTKSEANVAEKAIHTLEDMKAILLEGGWKQGSAGLMIRGHETCLVGAYLISTKIRKGFMVGNIPFMPALRELEIVCGDPMSLTHWNDQEGRTFGEVIDAIDAAIVLAKEHHRW